MATTAQSVTAEPLARPTVEAWTRNGTLVLVTCILAWAFDIFEQTTPQLVTPLLMKEWHLTPADIGLVTTASRWIGLIGLLIFPALADFYGRRPILMVTILGYSLVTGITGLTQNIQQFFGAASVTRVALSGEIPVGMVMVSETAPTRWRGMALGGLVGGYPFGYFLATLVALPMVPLLGWRGMYFVGIVPALLVFLVRRGTKESSRFEHASAERLKAGLKRQLDIVTPWRRYPRQMVLATLVNFLYLFAWIGFSSFLPLFLNVEKKLGFQTSTKFLTIWMACAIVSYWICGVLCDKFGRRIVIPAFVVPAAILLLVFGGQTSPVGLFIVGLLVNFLITGSFGVGLGYGTELFPTEIRGAAYGSAYLIGQGLANTAPLILGVIATRSSVAAGFPLIALSLFLLAPLFGFIAKDTSRHDLVDFVGEQVV